VLRSARRQAYRIAGALNGNGVRQGSLYPPTETHRQRLDLAKAQFQEAVAAFEAFRRQTEPELPAAGPSGR
jgi:hypothetical protein